MEKGQVLINQGMLSGGGGPECFYIPSLRPNIPPHGESSGQALGQSQVKAGWGEFSLRALLTSLLRTDPYSCQLGTTSTVHL